MESTEAKIGRSMKNREITADSPARLGGRERGRRSIRSRPSQGLSHGQGADEEGRFPTPEDKGQRTNQEVLDALSPSDLFDPLLCTSPFALCPLPSRSGSLIAGRSQAPEFPRGDALTAGGGRGCGGVARRPL